MASDHRIALRVAHVDDAERIARLHTQSWRRTYRGMMTDEFLDGGALENRRSVWHMRLGTPAANQYVCIAQEAPRVSGSSARSPTRMRSGVRISTASTLFIAGIVVVWDEH